MLHQRYCNIIYCTAETSLIVIQLFATQNVWDKIGLPHHIMPSFLWWFLWQADLGHLQQHTTQEKIHLLLYYAEQQHECSIDRGSDIPMWHTDKWILVMTQANTHIVMMREIRHNFYIYHNGNKNMSDTIP